MKSRSGVALVLVLWLIVLLSAICTAVVSATRLESGAAANYRARVTARYAAESAVTVAVAVMETRLAAASNERDRRNYLNNLDAALGSAAKLSLGAAKGAATVVDLGTRLDVNDADERSLAKLFAYFTTPIEAARAARAINEYIGGDVTSTTDQVLTIAKPLRSLDELERIRDVPRSLLERAAPYLTVDGDGTLNRATASDTVLSVAGGDLRDEASRIMIIARGWRDDRPLTHEIQAVYAIAGNRFTLVTWRERDL